MQDNRPEPGDDETDDGDLVVVLATAEGHAEVSASMSAKSFADVLRRMGATAADLPRKQICGAVRMVGIVTQARRREGATD